jgi:hypothetical protein
VAARELGSRRRMSSDVILDAFPWRARLELDNIIVRLPLPPSILFLLTIISPSPSSFSGTNPSASETSPPYSHSHDPQGWWRNSHLWLLGESFPPNPGDRRCTSLHSTMMGPFLARPPQGPPTDVLFVSAHRACIFVFPLHHDPAAHRGRWQRNASWYTTGR